MIHKRNHYYCWFGQSILKFRVNLKVSEICLCIVAAGSQCNQIIMLISEGIDYDYNATELFETSEDDNKPDESGYRPVRIFTFLVGTDLRDAEEMKDIACTNMGKILCSKINVLFRT